MIDMKNSCVVKCHALNWDLALFPFVGHGSTRVSHKKPAAGSALFASQGPQAAVYPQKQRSASADGGDVRAGENSMNFICLLLLCEFRAEKHFFHLVLGLALALVLLYLPNSLQPLCF